MKFLGRLFILSGLLSYLLAGYYIWLRNDPNRLSFQQYTYAASPSKAPVVKVAKQPLPVRIIIKELAIDLPIIPAEIIDDVWQTTTDGVSYLTSSPIPGMEGNSIIYGHNWTSLFGNLVDAVPGENVQIVYSDGSTKDFIIEYTSEVSPDTTSILAPAPDKRITLYTCSGLFDSKRFVAVAIYNEK